MIAFLKSSRLTPKRTSVKAPWQNGIAERWVGSVRREILDHAIALNEAHLRRLMREYITYHQQDRIHDVLGKDTPNHRSIEKRPSPTAIVISSAKLGGLYHRYSWREATIAKEKKQGVERLGRHRNGLSLPENQTLTRVDPKRSELVYPFWFAERSHALRIF